MMTLTIFLTENVRNIPGFREVQEDRVSRYLIPDFTCQKRDGRLCVVISRYDSSDLGAFLVPEVLRGSVRELIVETYIVAIPFRTKGLYRFKDAEASLDFSSSQNYRLVLKGQNWKNVLRLYYMIRSGEAVEKTLVQSWEKSEKHVCAHTQCPHREKEPCQEPKAEDVFRDRNDVLIRINDYNNRKLYFDKIGGPTIISENPKNISHQFPK